MYVYTRAVLPGDRRRAEATMATREDGLDWALAPDQADATMYRANKGGVCVGAVVAGRRGTQNGWFAQGPHRFEAEVVFFSGLDEAADYVARKVAEDEAVKTAREAGPEGTSATRGSRRSNNLVPRFHEEDSVDGRPGVCRDEHPAVLVGSDAEWVQIDDVIVPLEEPEWGRTLPGDVLRSLRLYAQRTLSDYSEWRKAEDAEKMRKQIERIAGVARSLEKYNRGGTDG